MSKVWEVIRLDPNEIVTLRLPTYYLSLVNRGCFPSSANTVVVLFDKGSLKVSIGQRIMCGTTLLKEAP